jgi:hypothetical protein
MIAERVWTRLRISAPAPEHTAILTRAVAPLLRAYDRAYFVPDPDDASISVYISTQADEDMQALRAGLLGALAAGAEVQLASAERTTIHHAQMTGTTAQELVEDFLCDASPLVLDLLEKSRGEASLRAALAFEMMAIQPLTMQQHLFVRMRKLQFPCTFISYRSHVDGFMIATKDPAATWQVFDDRYQRSSASMRTLVDALRLQVQAQGPVVSTAGAEWKRILDKYVGRVLQGLEFGGLMVASDPEEAGQHLGDRYDLSVSPFHQAVYKDRPLRDAVPTDQEFNAMRIMASLLYLTLHLMGIRLIERYLLLYAVCRCYEEIFSVSAAEAITQFSHLLVGGAATAERQ